MTTNESIVTNENIDQELWNKVYDMVVPKRVSIDNIDAYGIIDNKGVASLIFRLKDGTYRTFNYIGEPAPLLTNQ